MDENPTLESLERDHAAAYADYEAFLHGLFERGASLNTEECQLLADELAALNAQAARLQSLRDSRTIRELEAQF